MIKKNKVIVFDVDGTLTLSQDVGQNYYDLAVCDRVKEKLISLKENGYWIILYTSRNMRTYDGNIGQIMKNTAPILIQWLDKNNIPYDEIHFGKPWCGQEGYYVDDRAIRPREFIEMSNDEIKELLQRDKVL
jgi:capsule biosynthesis phosphatase